MKTKYEELRSLRNKILGEPKLERFSEVLNTVAPSHLPYIYLYKSGDYIVCWSNQFNRRMNFYFKDKRFLKPLGKEVSLQDILMMLEKRELNSAMNCEGEICYSSHVDCLNFSYIYIDLAKEIKEQDKKVTNQLIKLIK